MATLSEKIEKIFLNYNIKDIVINQYKSLQANDTINDAIKIILSTQNSMIVVFEKTKLLGWLTKAQIVRALMNGDEHSSVKKYVLTDVEEIDARSNLLEARKILANSVSKIMVVVENKQMIGIIDKENLDELLLFVTAKKQALQLQ